MSQALPQLPQLAGSRDVSTQVPVQHCDPAEHLLPQLPQLAGSEVTSTHRPPQQACPAVQLLPVPHRHVPATHISPRAQGGSHGTSVVQPPMTHTSPAEQALPQLPQLAGSEVTSTQRSPQQACPGSQEGPAPHWHVVPTQRSPARQGGMHGEGTQLPMSQISPAAQALPQPPQWFRSVWKSAQVSPQQVCPSGHIGPSPHLH